MPRTDRGCLAARERTGASVTGTRARVYPSMRQRVPSSPITIGSTGIPPRSKSDLRNSAIAQTCGGCQSKMIANSVQPATPTEPFTAASAISGAAAPAAPPTTAANGERGLSQRV